MIPKNYLLASRYQINKKARFQRNQTKTFLKLINKKYNKVLEVGCGRGYFSYLGARRKKFINCYGCDTDNFFQIKEIKQYAKSVFYKDVKNGQLPFPENFFDLVFSIDVIEHVKNDVNFIQENIRVCKKQGEIIIATPNYWRLGNLLHIALKQLKFPRNLGKTYYGNCIHLREYKLKELIKKITKSSYEKINENNIEIHRCWLGVLPLNIGFEKIPHCLNNFTNFFFIKFKKR